MNGYGNGSNSFGPILQMKDDIWMPCLLNIPLIPRKLLCLLQRMLNVKYLLWVCVLNTVVLLCDNVAWIKQQTTSAQTGDFVSEDFNSRLT